MIDNKEVELKKIELKEVIDDKKSPEKNPDSSFEKLEYFLDEKALINPLLKEKDLNEYKMESIKTIINFRIFFTKFDKYHDLTVENADLRISSGNNILKSEQISDHDYKDIKILNDKLKKRFGTMKKIEEKVKNFITNKDNEKFLDIEIESREERNRPINIGDIFRGASRDISEKIKNFEKKLSQLYKINDEIVNKKEKSTNELLFPKISKLLSEINKKKLENEEIPKKNINDLSSYIDDYGNNIKKSFLDEHNAISKEVVSHKKTLNDTNIDAINNTSEKIEKLKEKLTKIIEGIDGIKVKNYKVLEMSGGIFSDSIGKKLDVIEKKIKENVNILDDKIATLKNIKKFNLKEQNQEKRKNLAIIGDDEGIKGKYTQKVINERNSPNTSFIEI